MFPPDFPPKIFRFIELDSTNIKARELAIKGAANGTVVVADTQTAGKGSRNRVWHSPKGGLYFSMILAAKDQRKSTELSLLAGAALAQTVKQLLPKSVDVSVKWPNDCLVGWKKVGGVLCESLGDHHGELCIVGVGLNVNVEKSELAQFESNPFGATSFLAENSGSRYDLSEVLNMTVNKIFSLYNLYREKGFPAIQYLWEKNCQMVGKEIELREAGWRAEDEGGATVGTFLGIDEHGALVLSNARGERRNYVSGEITCFWP